MTTMAASWTGKIIGLTGVLVANTYAERRQRLLELLERSQCDALAVSHLPNVRYLCGFSGSNGLLLVAPSAAYLYTDPRYELQAAQEADCPTSVVKGSLWPALAKSARRHRIKRLGAEAVHVSHSAWLNLAKELGKAVKLKPADRHAEQLRMVKSAEEIAAIRLSVKTCSLAFERAVKKIRLSMSELDLAAELDYQMRRAGAQGPSFDTIVATAERSAFPHAQPTARRLESNRLLLVDMGASQDGYASDMTRMLHLGKPGRNAMRLYTAVREAQQAGLEAVRPGVRASAVDRASRDSLRRVGLDKLFSHSTGHGLGLEIHEEPRLGKNVDTLLEPGMVVTVEPGVYQEGFGGVRIEDTVLVTQTGVEVLTPTSKELLVLET
jgi:Xaa-Pro aminopeptidase